VVSDSANKQAEAARRIVRCCGLRRERATLNLAVRGVRPSC
jgi:hypothetical protein